MADDVPLRDYVDARLDALDQRISELAALRKAQVDGQVAGLNRRLDDSGHDRERIRETLGVLVPRVEYDRAQGQTLGRLGNVERTVARFYGGLAVVTIGLASLGVLLRYLVG